MTHLAATVVLLASCLQVGEVSIAGVYRNEFGFQLVTLTLFENGTYSARMTPNYGRIGTAEGTWKLQGEQVRLTPKKEDGHPMTGYLRVLSIREINGRRALIRKEDIQDEAKTPRYLYFLKAPNQQGEPMPANGPNGKS